jgi:hypothetical protein
MQTVALCLALGMLGGLLQAAQANPQTRAVAPQARVAPVYQARPATAPAASQVRPQGYAAPAVRPGAPAPAAANRVVPGVYKTYVPVPVKTATPTGNKKEVEHILIRRESRMAYSAALKAGFTLPLGDMAEWAEPMIGGGLEGFAHFPQDLTLGVGYGYQAFRYKEKMRALGATQALSMNSLTVRGIYKVARYDVVGLGIFGGIGYWMVNRAQASEVRANGTPITSYGTNSGFAFLGGLNVDFAMAPAYGLILDATVHSVSGSGGTGDSLMYGSLMAGGRYTF